VGDSDSDEKVSAGVEEMSRQIRAGEAGEGHGRKHGCADEQQPPMKAGTSSPEDGEVDRHAKARHAHKPAISRANGAG
jgi:hypothetical protein